jgi:hypothetical protein
MYEVTVRIETTHERDAVRQQVESALAATDHGYLYVEVIRCRTTTLRENVLQEMEV